MRNISFMLTTQQVIDETKTVTRRMGWLNAKVGELLQACEKCQGLGKGGKINKLKVIRLTEVKREPLNAITQAEVVAEGFPNLTPVEFVAFFCKSHKGCRPDTEVTVLRFEYVPLHKVEKCQWLPNGATLKEFEAMESALNLELAESMSDGDWFVYSDMFRTPEFYHDIFSSCEDIDSVWDWWVSEGKRLFEAWEDKQDDEN